MLVSLPPSWSHTITNKVVGAPLWPLVVLLSFFELSVCIFPFIIAYSVTEFCFLTSTGINTILCQYRFNPHFLPVSYRLICFHWRPEISDMLVVIYNYQSHCGKGNENDQQSSINHHRLPIYFQAAGVLRLICLKFISKLIKWMLRFCDRCVSHKPRSLIQIGLITNIPINVILWYIAKGIDSNSYIFICISVMRFVYIDILTNKKKSIVYLGPNYNRKWKILFENEWQVRKTPIKTRQIYA